MHILPVLSILSNFFYMNQPVEDMREEPARESKVVSQVIFSERIGVEKEAGEWSYIVSSDGHVGWVRSDSYVALEKPYEPSIKVSRMKAHVYGVQDTEYGPIITLPYGARLQGLEKVDDRWTAVMLPDGQAGYIQNGDIALEKAPERKDDLVAFSQRFLGLPYTWGGRSSFGFDCSGFVQMLYAQIGVDLRRNSLQQILDPRLEKISMDELELGDLIFFGKSEQRIMHVGMYIGEKNFIHTSAREGRPWLRISNLSDLEWCGAGAPYYPYRTFRTLNVKK
jgi:gamma-D-glutamyl-L-lysine dipeptidyl-peptidase